MHRYARFASRAIAALALLDGCSSSDAAPPADAGPEAAAHDAAQDAGCGLFCGGPQPDSGGTQQDGGDAGSICDQLKAMIDQLQTAAKACNTNATMQCNASTNGICCPITVTSSNVQAVNDYDHAVGAYMTTCMPSCNGIICPQVPSNACDGQPGGTMGVCE